MGDRLSVNGEWQSVIGIGKAKFVVRKQTL